MSIVRQGNSNTPSATTSTPSKPTRDPSAGPSPTTTSSQPSNASACEHSKPPLTKQKSSKLQNQDTRAQSYLIESKGDSQGHGFVIHSICRERRPAEMSKALSFDLRVRVLAVVATGASHRVAAARFGVSAASVSRWRRRSRSLGDPRPGALGGDRRSSHIEAHRSTFPQDVRGRQGMHHGSRFAGAPRSPALSFPPLLFPRLIEQHRGKVLLEIGSRCPIGLNHGPSGFPPRYLVAVSNTTYHAGGHGTRDPGPLQQNKPRQG